MDLFVTCSKTLEPLLAQELGALGYPQSSTGYCGVNVPDVDFEAVYRINYLSRLATRVLVPLTKFRCFDAKSLYQAVGRVDWEVYISSGKTIAIDANVHHPNLRNSLFAAQVAKDAICDQLRARFGWRPEVDVKNPNVQLNLYINGDLGLLSFDTSGVSLTKRGYRKETTEAPMQENLAAALLMIADFKETDILCDPCCGSGTLLTEAAMIASRTAPGFLRTRWGFMNLPQFSNEKWLKVKAQADSERIELPKNRIFGADISKQAIYACKVNFRAAGFHHAIEVVQSDVREYTPPAPPSMVITNPPYGMRLDDVDQLCPLYRALGDFMKQKTAKPAKGFVLTGSPELAKEVGLATTRRHVVNNGGLEARLLEFDLY